jgi:uncharacterized protein (TIGR00375 family)
MQHIVDIHIHSHYSRATSKDMNISSLYTWGKKKGITVMGTGDFTHPAWFAELQEKMEPAEKGLYILKKEHTEVEEKSLPEQLRSRSMRFLLTVEISTIYSKGGKVRKLHSVIVASSFEAAAKISQKLSRIGNLQADGRPILGLDTKELLKICLDVDPESFFVPAHIWTPWFGMFGSKSGFDSVEETFEELAPYVTAIETGLSSDPFMNWRVSHLEGRSILSNSDAHSVRKLGREANMMECELSYDDIVGGMRTNDERLVGTIEFYPEEGKYHLDGHTNCKFCATPQESRELNYLCPVCEKPLVLGVEHRVEALADRPIDFKPQKMKKVEYIVPLEEIIMQIKDVKSSTQAVKKEYETLLRQFGDEFSILRTIPTDEMKRAGFVSIANAVSKMRSGDVVRIPGYDGTYGVIKVVDGYPVPDNLGQMSLGM